MRFLYGCRHAKLTHKLSALPAKKRYPPLTVSAEMTVILSSKLELHLQNQRLVGVDSR